MVVGETAWQRAEQGSENRSGVEGRGGGVFGEEEIDTTLMRGVWRDLRKDMPMI